MFSDAELGHRLDKKEFERQAATLRQKLLEAQYRLLKEQSFSVLLLAHGEPDSGRTDFVNLLNEWMDPRHLSTLAVGPPAEAARLRPPMWRFWTQLPPRGRITTLMGSWYSGPLLARLARETGRRAFDADLQRFKHFERMLVAEGNLVIKLWFHLPARELVRRMAALAADKNTAWRVTAEERRFVKAFAKRPEIVEGMMRETSTAEAPWTVVDGHDKHWSAIQAGRILLDALTARFATPPPSPIPKPSLPKASPAAPNVLTAIQRARPVDPDIYEKTLAALQTRLARAVRRKSFRRHALVAVFEGSDAAGKGGAIRRVSRAIDARLLSIVPIAAPSEEERARPYLWRFWRHVPARGHVTIFDRSWYGRVLVERVEGFAREADWRRAYQEINEFEQEMSEFGVILVKFYLTVSPAEQLKRFRERERTVWKRFKIGPDDWRNRDKRAAYDHAVLEMVQRTSSELAPWILVDGDDKQHARLSVLRNLVERLEANV
jgi:AMP-polyphosphate phosphotransferase